MAQHHDAAPHGHRSADDEYLPVEGSSYERTDANVWAIVKFGLWLAVTALIVHVGMGLMYALLIERAKETTEQRYPLATTNDAKLPAEPRLQQYPHLEMETYAESQRQRLNSYGWIDKEQGRVHMPIDDAMRLMVERGLPARPDDPEAAQSGMMATDASSGRVMEKRRQ
jgi:hypothetical protein